MSESRNTENLPVSDTPGHVRILIASADEGLVSRYRQALSEGFALQICSAWPEAEAYLRTVHPELILFDPLLLNGKLVRTVSSIPALSGKTRIMLIENSHDRSFDQVALFKTGAHGFCEEDIPPALLNKAVRAVCNGEIWIQRKVITKLIDELARGLHPPAKNFDSLKEKSLARLTPRELEVAQLVLMGGNNKIIARKLNISERTVKAHLSAIFRKLNIENRLHLALFFSEVA